MATPMIQAKYASSSGNWYIGFDYAVSASAFDITKLYGWRSNVKSQGTLGMKITVNSGTANTSQTDTVTATFGEGAWDSTYWKFGGSNCNYAAVTGITANTITVTIEITSTFNDYLPKGTKFVYTIAMPVSKPTMNAVTIKSVARTSVTVSSSVSSNGGRAVTANGFSVYLNDTWVKGLSSLSGTISGLTPNTTYKIQSYGTNSVGTGYSASNTFTTTGNAPTVTASVSNVTRDSATISSSATYDTNASYSSHKIEWGYTTSYGSTTTGTLTGLRPNTTIYYKVSYTDNYNRTGTKTGSFMTLGDAPSITYEIVEVTATTVEIAFDTQFDLGTEFTYGWIETETETIDIGEPTGSIILTDLTPEYTYTYILGMMDANGYQTTVEITFTTLADSASVKVKTYVEGEGVVWKKGKVFYKQEQSKNILNLNKLISKATYTSISNLSSNALDITATYSGTYPTASFTLNLPVGSYKLSCRATWEDDTYTATVQAICNIGVYEKGTATRVKYFEKQWTKTVKDVRLSVDFTIENNELYDYKLVFYPASTPGVKGRTVSFYDVMINEGTTLLDYEPYVEPWRVAKKIYIKDTDWKEG